MIYCMIVNGNMKQTRPSSMSHSALEYTVRALCRVSCSFVIKSYRVMHLGQLLADNDAYPTGFVLMARYQSRYPPIFKCNIKKCCVTGNSVVNASRTTEKVKKFISKAPLLLQVPKYWPAFRISGGKGVV